MIEHIIISIPANGKRLYKKDFSLKTTKVDLTFLSLPEHVRYDVEVLDDTGCWIKSSLNNLVGYDTIKIYFTNNNGYESKIEFDIEFSYEDTIRCFTTNNYKNMLDIESMSQKAKDIESELNMYINTNDGICVAYYKTQKNSPDLMFREYNGAKYVDKQTLNILTEDNTFPTLDDVELGMWGAEFNTFSAEVSYCYFESIFGKGEHPTEGDFIYLEQSNALFTVYSSTLERGINGEPLVWKLSFGQYEQSELLDELPQEITSIETNTKIFNGGVGNEMEDITNIRENMSPQIYRDLNRSYVNEGVVFTDDGYVMIGGIGDAIGYINKLNHDEYGIMFGCSIGSKTSIMKIGDKTIDHTDSELVLFGVNTGINLIGNFYWVIINVGCKSINLTILNNNRKELSFNEFPFDDVVTGDVSLQFGDYEIKKIRIYKKMIPKELIPRLITAKKSEKSSLIIILDNCDDINLNPRAQVSNFKID